MTALAVLGLGEAGGAIASDLVAAGWDVQGWDPAPTPRWPSVPLADSAAAAVGGADVILSVNAAAVALEVAHGVSDALAPGQLFADANTAAAAAKAEVAAAVAASRVAFADVAFLAPVTGVATPALAAGSGASLFAELFEPVGMAVEIVGEQPGDAAALKLVRSVFMKGLAASVWESLAAAAASGAEPWLRAQIVDVIGEPMLERLLVGTRRHAARRNDEMEAAEEQLTELGVSPRVTAAAAAWLAEIACAETPSTERTAPWLARPRRTG